MIAKVTVYPGLLGLVLIYSTVWHNYDSGPFYSQKVCLFG